MIKMICDKCGKHCLDEVNGKLHLTSVFLPCFGDSLWTGFSEVKVSPYALCDDCLNKLKKWINEE